MAALTLLTVDRLAEQAAAPAFATQGRLPLTGPLLAGAWRKVLADAPGVFADVAEHPATVAALVRAHRELRELDEAALGAVASKGTLPEHLVRMHRAVVGATENRWYDVVDLRKEASIVLRASTQSTPVVLYLPQDLTPSQLEVVRALPDVTVVAGLTRTERADRGVLQSLERLGLTDPPKLETKRVAQEVLHASDSDDEVRNVVRRVVSTLQERPGHRIAVLYGAPVPYARLLHEQLDQAGIAFNGPGVRPTAERPYPRGVLQLLELAENGLDRVGLFRLLAGVRVLHEGSAVPAARWERLSRTAGIVSQADWEPRLTAYVAAQGERIAQELRDEAPRQGLIDRRNRDVESAEALLGFVRALGQRLAIGKSLTSWETLSRWALDLAEDYLGGEDSAGRPEEQRAVATCRGVLAALGGLEQLAPAADLATARDVVELQLEDDLPRTGTFGTGVFVGPLSSAVGLDLDEVYVLGLAEGLTPSRLREDALLPEAARTASGGVLPPLRARLDREQRHVLAALAAAAHVVASFPRGDLRRGGMRLPSRWLMPTLQELADDRTLQATDWERRAEVTTGSPSYAASVLQAERPASEREWRLQALSSGLDAPDDAVLDAAVAMLEARQSSAFTRYDGNLTAHVGELPDPADGQRVVSPTSLESWVSCPHAYFLQRVLYVEPVEQPEEIINISPADRGTLLHAALDQFFHDGHVPGSDGRWSTEQRQALRRIAEALADDVEAKGHAGHPTMWARERTLVLDDLERLLTKDEEVRIGEGRVQVRSELSFGRGAGAPVVVPLPDGRIVHLAGSADRLDRAMDGSLVVVDYKSGKADSFKGLSEDDPDKAGSKLQLPAYALAARAALETDAPVRAEYWFIGAKDRGKRIGYPVTRRVLARYAEVLQVVADGIGGGIFPANAPEDRTWSPWPACVYCDPDGLGAKERRVQWNDKKGAPEIAAYLALIGNEEGQG